MELAVSASMARRDERRRHRVRHLTEQGIRYFFGGNALVAIVVLALITIFLFREGFGFFGENLRSLRLYRTSGLEYVDIIRGQSEKHASLTRSLNRIRLKEFSAQLERARTNEQAQAELAPLDQFATA